MSTFHWEIKERNYGKEYRDKTLNREETSSHPLKGITVTVTESKLRKQGKVSRSSSISSQASASSQDPLSSALDGSDPLSQFAAQASDPLSRIAAESQSRQSTDGTVTSTKGKNANADIDATFEPWSAKKAAILSHYTTSEKLSITTSFLASGDREKVTVRMQSAATVSDKVKNHLEQLDDFEDGSVQEMLNLSQQEYVKRIDELNNALILAWDQDQRVRSLKIAIQCAKLLADVSVIHFYPSKFVLITDILDTFGKLVYDRIKNKATYMPKGAARPIQLPDNFTPDQVPDSAKETCRNWFFKIASIRELVPRFYVESAVLKCYGFLTSEEYNQALRRLGLMTRGIGDPLVSLYSRCYLCRVGIDVAPTVKDHQMPCFDDFLFTFKQIQTDYVQNILAVQKLDLPRYLTLYSPGLNWILQCLAHNASDAVLDEILIKCQKQCNSALLINSIMSAFKPEYVSYRAKQFTAMIKDCEDTGFPKHVLYKSLGMCFVLADPPDEDKLQLLNDVWKVVIKLKNTSDYISCAEVWIEYVVKNFSKRELNTILNDIIKHMTPDRAYEDHYPQLEAIVEKIVSYMHDFSQLFALERFLPFLDMFQKESVKVEVCKTIMAAYCRYQKDPTNDPVIVNSLMFISKTMHDSVNALSLDDDIRQIGHLISSFIRSISFGHDFEQQLSFYVEARASFSNIDAIIIYLVQCVNTLAMQTRKIVKGNHTRKTASFVRACAAFTYITIPSLSNIFSRLNLYLISGEVALANLCLSQADAFFKAAITLLPEVPRNIQIDGKVRGTEPFLVEYINNLASTLLVVPDNPDQGPLYLVRGLLNAVKNYKWDPNSDAKAIIFVNIITLLSAMCQENYLYGIDKVDSNDKLYGQDPKFISECSQFCVDLKDETFTLLDVLDKPETYKRQADLAHQMFCRVLSCGNMDSSQMSDLAVTLWQLAQKHGQLDTKISVRTLAHVRRQAGNLPAIKKMLPLLVLESRT
ncbi:hypothetical protein LSH36_10g11082 [Paralvinella palmiformis]|uniref:VPS35 endosomal protein sorting factor-like n=1 Tax=Paralvinella palmiformis TaxID=53620 RepID=A0AAD9KFA2_9ANNE|nr:hypothetical protein LSH36_10g11082 [Paralvinella palmiformis]